MSQAERDVLAQADAAAESLARVKSEIGQAVFGQERMIEQFRVWRPQTLKRNGTSGTVRIGG